MLDSEETPGQVFANIYSAKKKMQKCHMTMSF